MTKNTLKHPLFVIIGPSGSGKTRVTEAVFPKKTKIITHTTRPMRPGELPGVDYYFEQEKAFQRLYTSGKLIEQDTYHGYHYGVSLAEVIQRTEAGYAYTILTYSGFKKIAARFPAETVVVFFNVSKSHIQQRLLARETEPALVTERLALYDDDIQVKQKLQTYPRYHQLNANEPFATVVAELKKIVAKETQLATN